ncbi:integrase [Kosakonia sacchari]|nr:integrase [Kosakonia sacchari]
MGKHKNSTLICSPDHSTEHAKQTDLIFGPDDPNMPHNGNEEKAKET